jgi:hypothetical protein
MFKLNAEQKKYLLLGIGILGVVVGAGMAGLPFIPFKRKKEWGYSKYPLLWDVILSGESKTWNDYNFYKGGSLYSRLNPKSTSPFSNKLLTQMTIGEVVQYQSRSRSSTTGQLFATGRFQIIPSTLLGTYGKAKLNLSSLYNQKNQQALADSLIDDKSALKNYLSGKVTDTDANLKAAALALSQIWSSVGVPFAVNGKSYNQSYYAKDTASVDTVQVQKVLKLQRQKLS